MVITLYKKGITTREIADLLEKMYGNNYSPTTISNISKVMKNEIEAYHNRKIKKDFVQTVDKVDELMFFIYFVYSLSLLIIGQLHPLVAT